LKRRGKKNKLNYSLVKKEHETLKMDLESYQNKLKELDTQIELLSKEAESTKEKKYKLQCEN